MLEEVLKGMASFPDRSGKGQRWLRSDSPARHCLWLGEVVATLQYWLSHWCGESEERVCCGTWLVLPSTLLGPLEGRSGSLGEQ